MIDDDKGGSEKIDDVQDPVNEKDEEGKVHVKKAKEVEIESSGESQRLSGSSKEDDDNGEGSSNVDDRKSQPEEEPQNHSWQAVWDASRGAWYFWNSETQETTWENPLEKEGNGLRTTKPSSTENTNTITPNISQMTDEEIAEMCGIDPDLAYLDPSMYAKEIQQAKIGNNFGTGSYSVSGIFDNRTGKFISQPNPLQQQSSSSSPSTKIQQIQANKQLNSFFDIEKFENDRKKRNQEGNVNQQEIDDQSRIKRQKPTKKELKFFKERAKEKKVSKNSWLRN